MWQPVAVVAKKLKVDEAVIWTLLRPALGEGKIPYRTDKAGLVHVRARNVRRALERDAEARLRGPSTVTFDAADPNGWKLVGSVSS